MRAEGTEGTALYLPSTSTDDDDVEALVVTIVVLVGILVSPGHV